MASVSPLFRRLLPRHLACWVLSLLSLGLSAVDLFLPRHAAERLRICRHRGTRRALKMVENPYHPPTRSIDSSEIERAPSNAVLWRAYLFAPGVAPIAFVLMMVIILFIADIFKIDVNPASFLILPVLALTVGVIVCYVVAGAIGMPIAFFLRNRGQLNGYTIHGAAFGWAIVFCGAISLLSIREAPQQAQLVFGYLMCGVAPPVLLSGTVFWLLVRKHGRSKD